MDTFDSHDIWTLELGLWLGGVDDFAHHMIDGCLMVFPEPVGILRGNEILERLARTPRWETVEMADRNILRRNAHTVCIAYRAEAVRKTNEAYTAFCSSVYVRQDDEVGWKILTHQQTRWRRPAETGLPVEQTGTAGLAQFIY